MLCNVQILQPCQDHAAPAAAAAARPPLPGRGAGQHQPAAAGAAQATQDWEWGADLAHSVTNIFVHANLLSSMSPRCQAATRSRRGHARCPGCRGPACSSGSASRRRARWGPIRTRHLVTWPQCSSPIGQHLGMCMDGFMFGSCCVHDTQDNLIQDSGHTTSKVSSRSDLMIPLATFFFWLHNCPEISVTTIDVKARVDIFMA